MPTTRVIADLVAEPVTIEQVKNYIKLDESIDAEDALISKMITSARKLCEIKTNLAFGEKTFESYFTKDEVAFSSIRLPYAPHASIISITGQDITGAEEVVDPALYFKTGNKLWEVVISPSGLIYESYTVKFKAGYGISEDTQNEPKTYQTESLPDEAEMAILKQVASWYDNRDEYLPVLDSEVRKILDRISLQSFF